VVGVDLLTGAEVFRKEVSTQGIINQITAPWLSPHGTFSAIDDWACGHNQIQRRTSWLPGRLTPHPSIDKRNPLLSKHYLSLSSKTEARAKEGAPYQVHIGELEKGAVERIQKFLFEERGRRDFEDMDWVHTNNAFYGGKSANLELFKPGVKSVLLKFSDQAATTAFEFPW
jgi:hypothetical protein